MKKAAFYARVSSEVQKKEGTIQSQIEELKKQILVAGDVLTKEYIDNGYSGAKLDRPALDQLRKDLKTNLFDAVYFLNTDRIARDVTYQNLIIGEILKNKKQIIINGKDYVHNPENKFTLTILGAVAELERAKIIERSTRGKLHKLRQGILLSNGYNTFGYTYTVRTDSQPGQLLIEDREADIVKYIFKAYAEDKLSWSMIIRKLEDMGAVTKTGKKYWDTVKLTTMLKNHTYTGVRYFNTQSLVKEPNSPLRGIKYGKKVFKDKTEWIGVKVPTIISQELFDKAQERLEQSRKLYRNPNETQLLSNLVSCGSCGRFFTSYQRFYRYYATREGKRIKTDKIRHKVAYRCSRRTLQRMHAKTSNFQRCSNPEIAAVVLESCVFDIIKDTMVDPKKLIHHLGIAGANTAQDRFEQQLKNMEQKILDYGKNKKQLLEYYAAGKLTRREYGNECAFLDEKIAKIKTEQSRLIKNVPALHKNEVIDVSIRGYCETMKAKLNQCMDFETKRQFLLEYVNKVEYKAGGVTVFGSVPVALKAYNDPDQSSEASKINFQIEQLIKA